MKEYAVIFDTNSYRQFVAKKNENQIEKDLEELIIFEKRKNIVPFGSIIVGMEMLANVAEGENGFNYNDCLNGITTMVRHCKIQEQDTLRIFPQASLHILKSYFSYIPSELEKRTKNLAGVLCDIEKNRAVSINFHNEKNTFENIKTYVENEEIEFSKLLTALLKGIKDEILRNHPKISKKDLRKKLLDYIQNGSFEPLMAISIILATASKYNLTIPNEDCLNKAFSLNMEFPISSGFFNWICNEIVEKNIDMFSKTSIQKRWNWIWDYHVSFALNNSTLNNREVLLVTSDGDMKKMLKDYGYENRVYDLKGYLNFIKEE